MGLLDALLASLVLSAMLLWGGQVVGDWAQSRVMANEARTVAELARTGRLLIAGDVTHPARRLGVGGAPLSIPLTELTGVGLRSPAAGDLTPGRRTLSLWAWQASEGAVLVIARARGTQAIPRMPGAEEGVSGVGALLPGFGTRLVGPGVGFDMAALNAVQPGFATPDDLFALDHVALDVTCRSYLYRVPVDCDGDGMDDAQANTLSVDLDMGGNNITGAGQVTADSAEIGTLEGAVEVTGDLAVTGDLEVEGETTAQDLTVAGAFEAQDMEIGGTLTVGDLTATGDVTGANLAFDGTLTVSGTARLGEVDATRLTVDTLNVRQLSAEEGTFQDRVVATDVTTTSCRGCGP